MADESLTIFNRALGLVGAPRVSSLTELSASKTIIDDHWIGIRKEFAGLADWDGCLSVVDLVEDETAVKPDRWAKAWTLPTGFEQAWRLNDLAEGAGAQPLWEIFTLPNESPIVKLLFSDNNAAKLEYTFDPDTDLKLAELKGTATSALVHLLAVAIARPWGKKESDINNLEAMFERKKGQALFANGKQQKRKADRDRPLVDARRFPLRRFRGTI